MFASFLETMELAALDMIVVIDGAAYAPIDSLYYALYDAIIAEVCRTVVISGVIVLFPLIIVVLWCFVAAYSCGKKKKLLTD